MRKVILAVLLVAIAAMAQEGPIVNQSAGPPIRAWHQLLFYDGSDNLEYICWTLSSQNVTTWARTDSSLTSIAVSTNVGTVTTAADHGLTVGSTVVVSGATVDTDLNGTYAVVTVPSSKTFTITTASVTDATYTESTLVTTYVGPRTTQAIWAVQRLFYASGYLFKRAWAEGTSAANKICADRATYAYR